MPRAGSDYLSERMTSRPADGLRRTNHAAQHLPFRVSEIVNRAADRVRADTFERVRGRRVDMTRLTERPIGTGYRCADPGLIFDTESVPVGPGAAHDCSAGASHSHAQEIRSRWSE